MAQQDQARARTAGGGNAFGDGAGVRAVVGFR